MSVERTNDMANRRKFRGKSLVDGSWVTGFYSMSQSYHYISEPCRSIKVDPLTISQSTGITDKNGKEIFEGDILTDSWVDYSRRAEDLTVVVFKEGAFGFNLHYDGFTPMSNLMTGDMKFEVLGNIYDNPELMEMKKSELISKNGLLPHEFRIRALYDNGCMSVKGHLYIAEYIKKDRKKYIRVWDENSVIDNGKRRYGTYCDMDLGILGNDVVCPIYEIVKE